MLNCIILLNWNGWKDTIECLESVFRLDGADFRVLVCDNASTDGSLDKIIEWADGKLAAEVANPQLSHLTAPPIKKPVRYQQLTREQAESGTAVDDVQLTLIQTGANLGFAGGNNVGLRYALGILDCQYFWLLNNDTVVEPDALSTLSQTMQLHPEIGLCGSLNRSYYEPEVIQALGGKTYNRWTSRVNKLPRLAPGELGSVSPPMDFVNGASTMTSRAFLGEIGLMEESYFLYFEELDWAARAKGRFKLGYTDKSVIYHKEGASIGSSRGRAKRSLLSDGYLSRNRVLFTKRFYPWAIPSVVASVLLAAVHRFCVGDAKRARTMIAFMLRGFKNPAVHCEKRGTLS